GPHPAQFERTMSGIKRRNSAVGGMGASTVAVASAVLLAGAGSFSAPPTTTVLVMTPMAVMVGTTEMVITRLPPLSTAPRSQRTWPAANTQPAEAEPKSTPDGSVSVM